MQIGALSLLLAARDTAWFVFRDTNWNLAKKTIERVGSYDELE